MRWTVVIPLKALPAAKSRLVPASVDAAAHQRLVRAIRADTIAAASAADGVARVLLVTDVADTDVLGADVSDADVSGAHGANVVSPDRVLVQSQPGLNAALVQAAAHAAATWPADGVAALVGDLPALRPAELAAAFEQARPGRRCHVTDSAGTGTTLLLAPPGVPLSPAFGTGSAARHADDSVRLDAGAGLRQDVDTAADLAAALELGVGPRTRAATAQAPVTRSSPGNGIVGS